MERDYNISKMNSIYLRVSIVEPILISCMDKASFTDIHGYVQRALPNTTESETKEHLFYLINGFFIKYAGNSKTYSISQEGIDLLDIIYSHKNIRIVDYSNLTVKVE